MRLKFNMVTKNLSRGIFEEGMFYFKLNGYNDNGLEGIGMLEITNDGGYRF
jgi:hypothetical protein